MGRRVITRKDIPMFRLKEEGVVGDVTIGEAERRREEVVRLREAEASIDDYKTKLIKYIPAEIIAAFITIDGIIRSVAQPPVAAYWILFFTLLVLTPLYIWRVTTEPNKPPAKEQIFISTISFFIWVFALGGPFNYLSWYQPLYGALLLPIYTIVVPIIVGK